MGLVCPIQHTCPMSATHRNLRPKAPTTLTVEPRPGIVGPGLHPHQIGSNDTAAASCLTRRTVIPSRSTPVNPAPERAASASPGQSPPATFTVAWWCDTSVHSIAMVCVLVLTSALPPSLSPGRTRHQSRSRSQSRAGYPHRPRRDHDPRSHHVGSRHPQRGRSVLGSARGQRRLPRARPAPIANPYGWRGKGGRCDLIGEIPPLHFKGLAHHRVPQRAAAQALHLYVRRTPQ